MTALVHLDMEFTNDDIELGEIMQIGAIAHRFDANLFDQGDEDFMGDESVELNILCKVENPERASRWVLDNQRKLLDSSRGKGHNTWFVKNAVMGFLEEAGDRFGRPAIISGWCVANDYMFLKRLLPGYDGISYRTLELEDVLLGSMAIFSVDSDDVREYLNVQRDPDEDEHDALADARYQMRLMRAALRRAQKKMKGE